MNPITDLPKLIRSKKYVDEIGKDVKGMNPRNWKTSLIGIITCAIALATIWAPAEYQGKIQGTAAALAGVGLIYSKDHNN